MSEARVVDIQIQPIKGGGPLKLTRVRMTRTGLETVDGRVPDHGLFVVDARLNPDGEYSFITQRTRLVRSLGMYFPGSPKLALIRPSLASGGLRFSFGGEDEIEDPGPAADDPANVVPVRLFAYRGRAVEVPTLSWWLTKHLEREVKVVRTTGPWDRMTSAAFMANDNPLRAQDGYPVHAVVRGDAEAAFTARGDDPDINRFRYQILLEGLPLWAIHDYSEAEINGVRIGQPKPCDRCEVPAIDQLTGEPSMVKPLAGLRSAGSPIWIRPDTGGRTRIMGESWIPLGETIVELEDVVRFSGGPRNLTLDWGREGRRHEEGAFVKV